MLAITMEVFAQEAPKKGAVLRTTETQVVITSEQPVYTTTLELVRSRVELKRKFDTPIVQAPSALEATITPTETPDKYELSLRLASEGQPGSYNVIIKGSGVNKQRITGTMLFVTVEGGPILSSSDEK